MADKLVSIVIPVYNKEKYLKRCIDSVIFQTYRFIEIILIDDGSLDRSAEIIKSYANKDRRIRFIIQKNAGRSAARNKGIELASGKYILFLDADDSLDLNAIEFLVSKITYERMDVVVFGMKVISGTKKRLASNLKNSTITIDEDFVYKYLGSCGNRFGTSACNKFIDLDIVKQHSIFFPIDCSIGEDFIFCVNLALYSNTWGIIDSYFYNYYQNFDSTMHNKDCSFIFDMENFMNLLERYPFDVKDRRKLHQAIASANIKNIYKICKYIFRTSQNWHELYRDLREKIHEKKISQFYQDLDSHLLTFNYRLVYLFLRKKFILFLIILMYFDGKIKG